MSKQPRILVTGANGQLGMEFRQLAKLHPELKFYFVSKEECSITNLLALEELFTINSFSHCINCAAYTAVDKAETEEKLAFEINAIAPGNLAALCKKTNAIFFHFSTDYVFDGNAQDAYKEDDPTNPIGVYGLSKLDGERSAIVNNEQSIIIRTSWVFSSFGKNFVKTMARLMKEKENVNVVNDQFGSPTYAADLANAILEIIGAGSNPTPGIYHYSNLGITNWYEFATEIKKLTAAKCEVHPIPTALYPTAAKRPQNSSLNTDKIRSVFNITIPHWKDSLAKCILLMAE